MPNPFARARTDHREETPTMPTTTDPTPEPAARPSLSRPKRQGPTMPAADTAAQDRAAREVAALGDTIVETRPLVQDAVTSRDAARATAAALWDDVDTRTRQALAICAQVLDQPSNDRTHWLSCHTAHPPCLAAAIAAILTDTTPAEVWARPPVSEADLARMIELAPAVNALPGADGVSRLRPADGGHMSAPAVDERENPLPPPDEFAAIRAHTWAGPSADVMDMVPLADGCLLTRTQARQIMARIAERGWQLLPPDSSPERTNQVRAVIAALSGTGR